MPACGKGQRTHPVGKVWRLLVLVVFAFAFVVAVAWNARTLLAAASDDGLRQQRHLPSPVLSWRQAGSDAAVRVVPPQPPQPPLYLWASGGLGNRLFSLVGGLHLAAAAGRVPVLVWPVDDACHAPWTALFAPLATPGSDGGRGASLLKDEAVTVAGLLARRRQQQQTVAFLTPRLLREVRLAGGGGGAEASLRNSRETPLAEAAAALAGRGGGSDGGACGVYANDRLPLGFPEHARRRLLRPLQQLQPAVAEGVRAFAARHNVSRVAGVVGVHLRGTDAAGGGADAAAALADARRRFPGRRLFVCGDSEALETAFLEAARLAGTRAVRRVKRSYPTRPDASRPFRLEKPSSGVGGSKGARVRLGSNIHRDRQATEDALVDLVLLSRTRLPDPPLRGSVPSSFYAFAGFAQGIGLFDNV
eukprot:Rhum_TRINITY_DN14174_c1_g3::Rhum_TRINITY_DN14174_c1_g3_i1::g.70669::m.70669